MWKVELDPISRRTRITAGVLGGWLLLGAPLLLWLPPRLDGGPPLWGPALCCLIGSAIFLHAARTGLSPRWNGGGR